MTQHGQTSEARLEEAMEWFLRLNEPSRPVDEEYAFRVWLDSSAENRDAWAKACRTWEIMGETVPAFAPSSSAGRQQSLGADRQRRHMPSHHRSRRRFVAVGVTAIAACLVAIIAPPFWLTRLEADYRTATAETRQISLEDGSTVELAAASAIDVDFSAESRQVRLLAGEAYFDVRTDASRPFVVRTDKLDVTVVGTAFDVNVTSEVETVQLAHGIVNLSNQESGETLRLIAGDTAALDLSSGRLSRSTVAVDTIASWRDRKIFVQDVPISSVIAELQRYHPSWITMASMELGDRRITGLYDLSDPDRALEALVSPYGGKVRHVSPYLRVLTLF